MYYWFWLSINISEKSDDGSRRSCITPIPGGMLIGQVVPIEELVQIII